ncbi:MAG: coenzyme F420 hydrogenase [Candidatus Aminicenantes bacterium]|nr:coenzyme F420 hydrogenase [Candidatus Aminicenantes bacterium]
MSNALKIKKETSEGILDFLKYLLETEKVKGIFTLRKMNDSGARAYSLISSLEELKNADPFYPVMPVNAGKALSAMTLTEALNEPVAAVLRPCELRAFVELVKRAQADTKNILLISLTCEGVYPFDMATNGDLDKLLPAYKEASKKGENANGLRRTCETCAHSVPSSADITVLFAGNKDLDTECTLVLNTPLGEEYARGASGNMVSAEIESKELTQLIEKRKEERNKMFQEKQEDLKDMTSLVKTFAACLSCHGCMHVCPICYCFLCDFDSKVHEDDQSNFGSDLTRKGGARIPSGTLLFHIGRMTHMAVSCVNCGMCSDVCPVNIPVAEIFTMVGDPLQKIFDYLPGRDVNEPVPSGTYKEDEFKELGE